MRANGRCRSRARDAAPLPDSRPGFVEGGKERGPEFPGIDTCPAGPRRAYDAFMLRRFASVLVLLFAVGAVAHWSGNQPRLDAVEFARRETGLALERDRIAVGAITLHVVRAGPAAGPPVVLLHGFPEFWFAWKDVIGPLARAGFRVIVPDQRGAGDSDRPHEIESFRIDQLGDDIASLIAALGLENAFVAGHDWGGAVAWNLAIRHPERVRRLVVLGTPHPDVRPSAPARSASISWYRTFFRIPWLPEESARWGNWGVLSKILRDTAEPGAFPDAKLDVYRSAWDRDGAFGAMVDWYRAAFRHPVVASGERRVRVPTQILVAARDAFIPAESTRASAAFCDDAHVIELGIGTHWVIQEQPERIARSIAAFFGPVHDAAPAPITH